MIQEKHRQPLEEHLLFQVYYFKSTYSKVSAQFISKVYGFQALRIFINTCFCLSFSLIFTLVGGKWHLDVVC